MNPAHIMGVDEAGRGPLAGPVAVGIVRVSANFDIRAAFPKVNDSKKISEKVREAIYREMQARAAAGEISFCVELIDAHIIDTIGISASVRQGVHAGVHKLSPEPAGTKVLLDGLLHAPDNYAQETIIKGDALEPVISLASIAAKVERDWLMKKLGREYPGYGFEQHKGYGTRAHYAAIKTLGISAIHRRTFLGFDRQVA
jgi:ribonuclease HII